MRATEQAYIRYTMVRWTQELIGSHMLLVVCGDVFVHCIHGRYSHMPCLV